MPTVKAPASGRACGMVLFHLLPLLFRCFQITSTFMRCITAVTGTTSVSCSVSALSSAVGRTGRGGSLNKCKKAPPNDDEVLVEVHAAYVNYADTTLVRGESLVDYLMSGRRDNHLIKVNQEECL